MHDLVVRLAVRIEVRTALCAADGQASERILEHLLEREEFQNVEVDARMEAQAALVGADRAAHLHAETAVHLDFTLVILPGDTEHDDALWLDHALEELVLLIVRMLIENRCNGLQDFRDSVFEMRLSRVLLRYEIQHGLDVLFAV